MTGRTCTQNSCDDATGALAQAPCDGYCLAPGAPALVSAALSDNGRQVTLAFDQAVTATSHLPRSAARLRRCCWRWHCRCLCLLCCTPS